MRLNKDRRELLEDIFAPEDPARACSADDVLRLVHAARRGQRNRRRAVACVAACLAAAACIVSLWPERAREALPVTTKVPAAPVVAAAETIITPPTVERVDDEEMLAMFDKQPAALVRWPDGRQSLLVLVANPPQK